MYFFSTEQNEKRKRLNKLFVCRTTNQTDWAPAFNLNLQMCICWHQMNYVLTSVTDKFLGALIFHLMRFSMNPNDPTICCLRDAQSITQVTNWAQFNLIQPFHVGFGHFDSINGRSNRINLKHLTDEYQLKKMTKKCARWLKKRNLIFSFIVIYRIYLQHRPVWNETTFFSHVHTK